MNRIKNYKERLKKLATKLPPDYLEEWGKKQKELTPRLWRGLGMGLQGQIDEKAFGKVESLTGTQGSSNKDFTVTKVPKFITINGQIVYEDSGYTRSNFKLTLDHAPFSTDILKSHY